MPRNPNGFLAQRKAEPGKKIQMTERHLNWILLRKIKKADESLPRGVFI